ncbi:MAG: endo-1,4-beta-xylanase [Kiritimatiellae bacterium]|nr:endo-1,4-beta-xylanase [Kiritimatiellia bacterium]
MRKTWLGVVALTGVLASGAEQNPALSAAYWKLWNPEVQDRIDRDIGQHRKADASLKLADVPAGTEVKVEQLSHDFIFGAHIFNFDQLGTPERNRKYKELYGTLFNSATIAFYWKTFEVEPGRPRFKADERDTEAYWNSVKEPKKEPHWRRPATDPVVGFCESKGVRLHGHTIIWGSNKWQYPEWLFERFCPPAEKAKILALGADGLKKLTPAQIGELAPVYCRELRRLFEKRVVELAGYYKGRLHSWDVVNESATDFSKGHMIPGDAICKSVYGLMPGDYTYHAFKTAGRLFPENVALNINDYLNSAAYTSQVKDLLARGCRIDIMGTQMHLFNPQQCLDIADGKPIETPEIVWKRMETLAKAGLPLHLSEITITSPGDDARGREIQAVIARNLYRLWFSVKPMMGITWWNVVDDCGAPGEPSVSGLFTRDMEPKPSFHALNGLINGDWKTRLTLKAGEGGSVRFRGFKGRYRVTYTDASGTAKSAEFRLAKDGDGGVLTK